MKTLIIYDNEGYILTDITGSYRVPTGVPYLEVEVPEGKKIKEGIGVDVTVTPHQIILEDIPISETELLKQKIEEQELAIIELANIIGGAQ